MRQIRFRGKRVDNGEWVYGGYYSPRTDGYSTHQTFIIVTEELGDVLSLEDKEVIPETVGQFTGLQDKNGKDIYEGDVTKWIDEKETRTGIMMWDNHSYGFRIQMPQGYHPSFKLLSKHMEITGNIHDK